MAVVVHEFTPDQAKETVNTVAGGIAKVLHDAYGSSTLEVMTSYMIGGNLYVVVST